MIVGHKKQWEFLKKKHELNQLSHAYLFTGAGQIGKKTFAREFAKYINCSGERKPCGECFNCKAIERGGFPDFMFVAPQEGGEIQISQIKQIQNFLSYKSYYGSFKTVVTDDAENMNQEAQSCFLKTLEEPKGKTLLILISSKPDMFLPTISSRCQTVKFFRPKDLPQNPEKIKKEQEIFKALLPVTNSTLAEKFKYVKSLDFEKEKLADILEVMQRYLRHLLFTKTGIGQTNEPAFVRQLADFGEARNYSVEKIKNIINLVEDINQKSLFTNANPKLALEILLMEF